MSLSRQFLREFRPFFHMFDEPLGRSPAYWHWNPATRSSFFEDPFFASSSALRPAIDVHEQGGNYIVEAELPGVKKENISVRVGDGGRSLTVEGKVFRQGAAPSQEGQAQTSPAAEESTGTSESTEGMSSRHSLRVLHDANALSAVAAQQEQTAISTERMFTGTSSFTRTVMLPLPVDSSKVSAKLADGILTVTVPKAPEVGSVQINVE
ncbi:HSP20-like chaperone [Ganoderma leucocontextum]|nr:HSP20-like chaperone [Ganoderma leucocontextum]